MHDAGSPEHQAGVTITVFPITGRQLFFTVPERWCEECDLTIRVVKQVVSELDDSSDIRVRIRPWINYLPFALIRGGWHPPVVTINKERFSQGTVPDAKALLAALAQHLEKRGAEKS